ncbi:MAG TPA: phage tail tip lysozyme [Candidatus Saccharimonadales bacterium]
MIIWFSFFIPTNVIAINDNDREAILRNHVFYDADDEICGVDGIVAGGNNLEVVWNYFITHGFSQEQAAGIIGNLLVESAGTLDPRIRQGGDFVEDPNDPSGQKGRGIAQWTFSERWQTLLRYAEALNKDPLTLDLQLDFIMFEMTGQPPAPGVTGGSRANAFEMLTATQTVEDAAVAFARYYEANQLSIDYAEGKISYEQAFRYRISPAEDVYEDLAGTSGSTGVTCGGGDLDLEIIKGDTTEVPCQGQILGEQLVDGYDDGSRYRIRICQIALPDGSAGPWVNSQISGVYYQMAQSASASGISLRGGGFRTMQGQIDARIRNGCPDIYNAPASSCRIPTARPGYSNHQMGFAVDMSSIPVSCPHEIIIDGRSFCQAPGNATWEWLTANAGRYGLYQLRTEIWHWSIDGT